MPSRIHCAQKWTRGPTFRDKEGRHPPASALHVNAMSSFSAHFLPTHFISFSTFQLLSHGIHSSNQHRILQRSMLWTHPQQTRNRSHSGGVSPPGRSRSPRRPGRSPSARNPAEERGNDESFFSSWITSRNCPGSTGRPLGRQRPLGHG